MQDAWVVFAARGTSGLASIGWTPWDNTKHSHRVFGNQTAAVLDEPVESEDTLCYPL